MCADTSNELRTELAGCTPRVYPRPKYPSYGELAWDAFVYHTRSPLLLVAVTVLLEPWYAGFVAALMARGWTEQEMFVLGTFLCHAVPYVVVNGFFGICDHYGFLARYKLDRGPSQAYTWSLLGKTLFEAATGQLLIGPVVTWYAYEAFLQDAFVSHAAPVLPTVEAAAYLFAAFAVAKSWNAVLFYFAHRLLHHKTLYPWVHKQHHTYTGSISVGAEYAHPIEQIFANFIPTLGGVLVLASHPFILYVWVAARLEQTYAGHSGYAFYDTWLYQRLGLTHTESALFHDFHHADNSGNFAELWLDGLFGTCDPWLDRGGFDGYWARNHAKEKAA